MKTLINISLLIFFSKILISCGARQNVESGKVEGIVGQYKIESGQVFSGSSKFVFSSDSSRVICVGNKNKFSGTFSFFVFSILESKKCSSIYNNVELVEWVDNSEVKYKFLPGNIKIGEEPLRYRYIKFDNKH